MKVEYPNGSYEMWCDKPRMLVYIKAPNPFGTMWTMQEKHGVHNNSTEEQGIFRKGRKWYLGFDKEKGWYWK